MDIYQLAAEFIADGRGNTHYMLFLANSTEDATHAAWGWVRNRQQAVPDYFGVLGSLKVCRYHVGIPEPSGYIKTGPSLPTYEWKYDGGIPPLIPALSAV